MTRSRLGEHAAAVVSGQLALLYVELELALRARRGVSPPLAVVLVPLGPLGRPELLVVEDQRLAHHVDRHRVDVRVEGHVVHVAYLAGRQNVVGHGRGDEAAVVGLVAQARRVDGVVGAREARRGQARARVGPIERAEGRDRDGLVAAARQGARRRRQVVRGPDSRAALDRDSEMLSHEKIQSLSI